MDLLQTARFFSMEAHKGERLKFVRGPYYTHPKAVSERQWTVQAKVVALLHDTVETHVKKVLGKNPDPAEEERVIAAYLAQMDRHFKNKGCDISALIPDIDILTKRTTDKNYSKYIARIIAYAQRTGSMTAVLVKLADLEDNSLPERNPSVHVQTDKDKERLARYAQAMRDIREAFPGIELRPRPEDRPRTRDLPGHGRMNAAALKAKENAGSRGAARRAQRPGANSLGRKPPGPDLS